LAAGTYNVKASAFGYLEATASVTLVSDQTSTLNLSLEPDQVVTVTGTVTDAGHPGLPLYAQINPGAAASPILYTDPLTGTYSVSLFQHQAYTFTVDAVAPGFVQAVRPLTLTTSPQVEDFALQVNEMLCSAPGYLNMGGLKQTFDSKTLPAGWTVTDPLLNGDVWAFNDPGEKGNLTGGTGGFAILDSDYYDLGSKQDSSLVTPAINFSTFSTVTLSFKTAYNHYSTDTADVDVSNNGGSTWVNVWRRTEDITGLQTIDISAQAAGQSSVTVRFHYYDGNYDWYWEVDDIYIGPPNCLPQNGGMVMGFVEDENFATPINGAAISSSSLATISISTPSDPALPDGFYQLFLPEGSPLVTATHAGYGASSQTVPVAANTVQQADFNLPAGLLEITPITVSLSIAPDHASSLTLTLANSGGMPATYVITTINADLKILTDGPYAENGRSSSPKRLLERTARYVYILNPPLLPGWPNSPQVVSQTPIPAGISRAWGLVYQASSGQTWISGEQRGQPFLFPASGQPSPQYWLERWAADMAWNPFSSTFWQVNAGYDYCLHETDPSGASTRKTLCPPFGASERGLAFDPLTRTYYAGSWTNRLIIQFDETGHILRSIAAGLNISGLAFNPATRHLFILTSVPEGYPNLYLYNPDNDAWLGAYQIPGFSAYGGAALDITCNGHLLALDQAGSIFEIDAGEPPACDWDSVPWLSIAPVSGTVNAHASQTITLQVNANGMIPGSYQAHLHTTSSTPYAPLDTAVNLTVTGSALFFPLTVQP
nr:choice-of-anchor J domain-containing protein [Anaerolineaceae bacterium]